MPPDTGDIFAQMGLTPSADALVGQEMAARTAPVFPLPNVAAKSDMLPPAAPQMPQGGGGMALPPPMSAPALAPPAPRYEQPPIAAQPLPGEDPAVAQKEFMRRLGTALATNGSAAQRVQGLQMLAEAGQPTEAQQQARERQRLVNVIDMAPVDEATKHRAAIAVHLGAKPDEVMKSMGLDQPAIFSGAAAGGGVNGQEFLSTLPPAIGTQVKALAEGRMQFPSSFALKQPYWQQMLQAVAQYDPSFDAVNYNARSKTRNAFVSGKEGRDLNALNTAIGHLGQLSDEAVKLDNYSNVGPGGLLTSVSNLARNVVKSQKQDPTINNFNTVRDKVAEEFTRLYRGAGGSESDIKREIENLNAANSPPQLHGAIQRMSDLAMSKAQALGDQYNQGMGTTKDPMELLHPKAQEVVSKVTQRALGMQQARVAGVAAPAVGTVQQGHRFLGGDPADRRSWEPVQ